MKTLAAFSLAFALLASSAMTLRAQDRDRGPSAYKSGESVTGQVTAIDPATKTIMVNTGSAAALEYQAKDSTELAKFHVGDTVSGKVSKDTPPKLTNLKASSKAWGGAKDSTGSAGMGGSTTRDSARTGGMGSPRD